jgi:hypothetical protein
MRESQTYENHKTISDNKRKSFFLTTKEHVIFFFIEINFLFTFFKDLYIEKERKKADLDPLLFNSLHLSPFSQVEN